MNFNRLMLACVPILLAAQTHAQAVPDVPGVAWADAQRKETIRAVLLQEVLAAEARAMTKAGWNPFFSFPDIIVEQDRVRAFDWHSGAWREAGVADYLAGSPQWTPIFAIATLNRAGAAPFMPRPWNNLLCSPSGRRCMIAVTTGGFDEVRWLEIDTVTKTLVPGGFDLPASRGALAWMSEDTLLVTTGRSSAAGYPLEARIWRRGTALAQQPGIFAARPGSDAMFASSEAYEGGRIGFLLETRGTDPAALTALSGAGEHLEVSFPVGFPQGTAAGQLAILLTQDWSVGAASYPAGSLLSFDLDTVARGRQPEPEIVYQPQAGQGLGSAKTSRAVLPTSQAFYFTVLRKGGQAVFRATRADEDWQAVPVLEQKGGVASLVAADPGGEAVLAAIEDPVSAAALYRLDGAAPPLIKRAPSYFDATRLVIEQGFARANDGVLVPYWLVRNEAAKGPQPTIIHAYGADGIPLLPGYHAEVGRLWLARGGSYVIAQVRGGGEFGPAWAQAGSGLRSGQAVDDLLAVAQELIASGNATPASLGLFGRSAGGALVASAATLRPDLFAAVVSQDGAVAPEIAPELAGSPVLEAQRRLLETDPGRRLADRYWPTRAFSKERGCPPLLLTSWRGDQRVPAEQSRALAAQHRSAGCPTLLFEQPAGDHGVLSPEMLGVTYGFFSNKLGLHSGDEQSRHSLRADPLGASPSRKMPK